ncbi:MAG TPA: DUF4149 domain-containing protein [Pyrinomonadaceae bacterium]|nr:DUF4149 domain-containing protein [Pyrinomonadaceae bacterium]
MQVRTKPLTILNDIRFFLLAFWLGAATFFSLVVAPSAFLVLRQFHLANANEIAGTIVTRTLSVINISGVFVSLLALVATLAIARRLGRSYLIQLALLIVIAVTTAVGQWFIAARMRAIRATLELPIDQIALDDPRRLAFANLHHYSVITLGIAMLAALIATVLIRLRPVS